MRSMRQQTPATTKYDDGSDGSRSQRSRLADDNDPDDAKSSTSRVSKVRSDRSGSVASSMARSSLSQTTKGDGNPGILLDRTGSGGASLEVVQEESRIHTAVSEGMKMKMALDSALQLGDLEASLADDQAEDLIVVDWDDVMQGLLPLIQEALESEETEIRRNALVALRKSVGVGEMRAMPLIETAVEDEDWMCREGALLALRELALPGDSNATDIVCKSLEDARREVREGAIKALETVGRPGDQLLVSKLVTMKEYSRKWSDKTKRPAWEIRETVCRALGIITDLDCEEAIESLQKSLGDEKIDVQRAATYAMGLVGERVVPEDMVWSYNNVTAQPAVKSTWLNVRWNVLRQAYIPCDARAPVDVKLKHSPRECMQALVKTPRGGPIPHLLLTPRQEHLYEGEDVHEALRLREEKRKDGEKVRILADLAFRIKHAAEHHDPDEVARLQVTEPWRSDARYPRGLRRKPPRPRQTPWGPRCRNADKRLCASRRSSTSLQSLRPTKRRDRTTMAASTVATGQRAWRATRTAVLTWGQRTQGRKYRWAAPECPTTSLRSPLVSQSTGKCHINPASLHLRSFSSPYHIPPGKIVAYSLSIAQPRPDPTPLASPQFPPYFLHVHQSQTVVSHTASPLSQKKKTPGLFS